ncbi:amino acid ABC transporter permease [Geodermatophilus sp. URMC 64]
MHGSDAPSATPYPTTIVRRLPYGQWLAVAVLAVLLAMLAHTLLVNDRFGWAVVGEFFFSDQILQGLWRTLWLTALAMLIGVVLGTALAVARMSTNPVLSQTAGAYIWFFRGTPLLIQLVFWYNLAALYPKLSLGIPFGPEFVTAETNALVTVYVAAVLGLGLNEAAYMAEIIRSALLSVDYGQTEAAHALGMTGMLTFRRVVFPQAVKILLPPTANQTIGMLKYTSLVSVLALPELLYSAQLIYSQNFQTIPLLIVVALWYLVVTTVLTYVQYLLEKKYGRGDTRRPARKEATFLPHWRRRDKSLLPTDVAASQPTAEAQR